MRFPCQRFVGAGVIILMALGSVAPRTITHSRCWLAKASTHGAEDYGHAHDRAADRTGDSACVLHTHVFWLGMETVTPAAPTRDNGPSETADDGSIDLFFGRVANAALLRMELSQQLLVAAQTYDFCSEMPADAGHDTRPIAARESAPLCDAARFERTGVFLL